MSAQHTPEPWAQGATLSTKQTDRWSTEELELNQARERRLVFARFTPIDDGRSRQRIAICERPEDAARIVQCVNAHGDLARDAARYRWLRDVSVSPHNFYISVPDEFVGVRYSPQEVDAYIDAAIAKATGSTT